MAKLKAVVNPFVAKNPTLKLMTISPSRAIDMLQYNNHGNFNRNLKPKHLEGLKESYDAYGYQFGATMISFDVDGNLINGQHTLNTIIATGVTADVPICMGCNREAIFAMDKHSKRSRGDDMKIMTGHKDAYWLVAGGAIALHYNANKGKFVNTGESSVFSKIPSKKVYNFIEEHKDFYEALTFCKALNPSKVRRGTALGMYYLMSKLDKVRAEKFWYALEKNQGGRKNDPARMLHSYIDLLRKRQHSIRQQTLMALIGRAWNDWVAGRRWSRVPAAAGAEIPTLINPKIKLKED